MKTSANQLNGEEKAFLVRGQVSKLEMAAEEGSQWRKAEKRDDDDDDDDVEAEKTEAKEMARGQLEVFFCKNKIINMILLLLFLKQNFTKKMLYHYH